MDQKYAEDLSYMQKSQAHAKNPGYNFSYV